MVFWNFIAPIPNALVRIVTLDIHLVNTTCNSNAEGHNQSVKINGSVATARAPNLDKATRYLLQSGQHSVDFAAP